MRVYLVERHIALRDALHEALDAAPGIRVVGASGSVGRAAEDIPHCSPHIAVLGEAFSDGDRVSLCWHLSQLLPHLRVVFHGSDVDHSDDEVAEVVGASAYVPKQIRVTGLIGALRATFNDLLGDRHGWHAMRCVQAKATCERSWELVEESRRLLVAVREGRERRARQRRALARQVVRDPG